MTVELEGICKETVSSDRGTLPSFTCMDTLCSTGPILAGWLLFHNYTHIHSTWLPLANCKLALASGSELVSLGTNSARANVKVKVNIKVKVTLRLAVFAAN
jgi:hypothetical protein